MGPLEKVHLFEKYGWEFILQECIWREYYNCSIHLLKAYIGQVLVWSTLCEKLFTWATSFKSHNHPLKRFYYQSHCTHETEEHRSNGSKTCWQSRTPCYYPSLLPYFSKTDGKLMSQCTLLGTLLFRYLPSFSPVECQGMWRLMNKCQVLWRLWRHGSCALGAPSYKSTGCLLVIMV